MRQCIRINVILLVLLLITTVVTAQPTFEERDYLAYVPASYAGEPIPLLIVLHGYGDTVENMARATRFDKEAERFGFAVVYPEGYLLQWNDGSIGDHYEDDTAYLLELIELAAANINVDRDRIYLVGFSNGGTMTFRAYCEAADTFAAIATVSGPMRIAQTCDSEAQTSVLMIYGTGDEGESTQGGNGRYSAPETIAYWAQHDGCTDQDIPVFDPDFETEYFVQYYDECEQDTLVMLYAIAGMGHTWPGAYERINDYAIPMRLDANLIIWSFFEIDYLRETSQDDQIPYALFSHNWLE